MFFNAALVISAAAMVIYTYGLLSPSTAFAFFSISLCTLSFAAKKLYLNISLKNVAIESSEKKYFLGGHCFRTYIDSNGALWIRYEDIYKRLKTERTATFMRRKYSQYFCKANPILDVWYVHPKALQALIGRHHSESDLPVVDFLENQIIGVHYGLLSLGGKQTMIPEPIASEKKRWVILFWNGELGLITTLLLGGALLYISSVAFDFLCPKEFVLHYQQTGIVYISSIISTGVLMFWCGHGIILATQHWLASGRSILMAFIAILIGLYLVTLSLEPFVKKYNQYSFVEWLYIVADKDEKASVYYDPSLKGIIINGDLGFGTTIKLLETLKGAPNTKIIGLKSYGGRVAEGDAIHHIIKERNMDTYAWAECMSSCVIIYVAGKNRYITETAQFGLHRSGHQWDEEDTDPSESDYYIADMFRKAGVSEWLIIQGMIPTIHNIYLPSAQEVLDAKLATAIY
jgi:hypothetical protein